MLISYPSADRIFVRTGRAPPGPGRSRSRGWCRAGGGSTSGGRAIALAVHDLVGAVDRRRRRCAPPVSGGCAAGSCDECRGSCLGGRARRRPAGRRGRRRRSVPEPRRPRPARAARCRPCRRRTAAGTRPRAPRAPVGRRCRRAGLRRQPTMPVTNRCSTTHHSSSSSDDQLVQTARVADRSSVGCPRSRPALPGLAPGPTGLVGQDGLEVVERGGEGEVSVEDQLTNASDGRIGSPVARR